MHGSNHGKSHILCNVYGDIFPQVESRLGGIVDYFVDQFGHFRILMAQLLQTEFDERDVLDVLDIGLFHQVANIDVGHEKRIGRNVGCHIGAFRASGQQHYGGQQHHYSVH